MVIEQLQIIVDLTNTGFEKPSVPPTVPFTQASKPCQHSVKARSPTDCILKISSKPHFLDSDIENSVGCQSSVPVSALVGAFEVIGTTQRHLCRPLTIHVDSFSSDAFAHTAIMSPTTACLKRSQSLQVFNPPGNKPSEKSVRQSDIKTVTSTAAPKLLQPYWKIKMNNDKRLIHSISSAAVSSKDTS